MKRFIQKPILKRAKINGTMKTFTLILAALLFTLAGQATVITVDNNPKSPADYTDLQTAVDSSISGDTLYIQGSPTSYGSNINIDHQLTLIGPGYDPTNQWGLKAKVHFLSLEHNSNANTNANGTKIIGMHISNHLSVGYKSKNIYVARCMIDDGGSFAIRLNGGSGGGGDSWLIENNIIKNDINIRKGTNMTVTNNLFLSGQILNSDKPSVLITNNTFHYSGNSSSTLTLSGNQSVANISFKNNILINSTAGSSGCSGCAFENNITTENQDFVFGSRSGSNNMVNTNPDLEDTSNGPNNPFDNDYTPTSSSSAINAGTDGTDIGITGGSSPTDVHSTNMPAIPQVIEMNIYDMTIPQNDSLQIDIRARDQE